MKFVAIVFLSVFLIPAGVNADEAVAIGDKVAGQKTYESSCKYCHKLTDKESMVGAPGFKDVTKRRSIEWLNSWLKSPEAFAKTDVEAKKLIESNTTGLIMPTLPEMQDDQHRLNIIEFLKTL